MNLNVGDLVSVARLTARSRSGRADERNMLVTNATENPDGSWTYELLADPEEA